MGDLEASQGFAATKRMPNQEKAILKMSSDRNEGIISISDWRWLKAVAGTVAYENYKGSYKLMGDSIQDIMGRRIQEIIRREIQ